MSYLLSTLDTLVSMLSSLKHLLAVFGLDFFDRHFRSAIATYSHYLLESE